MQRIFLGGLVLVPLALWANFSNSSDTLIFFLAAASIIPLAKFLGDATEDITSRSSPALGGFLNATFGNATELIIGIFALNAGLIEVVKASITGSIVGNLLLVLGASVFFGGLNRKKQTFNRTAALASSSTLFLAVIALAIPQIFVSSGGASATHNLSTLTAIIMFIIYIASLIFMFATHQHLYAESDKHETKWSLRQSIIVLALATAFTAWLSDILVNAIQPVLSQLGWTELFVGGVIVAIIGNAAEHASAVRAAVKNRMELSIQIAVSSATQIALFVTPLLVFTGLVIHQDMNLIFGVFPLAAIVLSVFIASLVIQDGESNWLEGAMLLSAYSIIAVGFYLYAA